MPLIHVKSRLILEGLIPWLLRVAQYWLIRDFVIWNAHGSFVIFVKISIFPRLDFPCSSCLPFKSHQICVSSDRRRLSVGFDSHSLLWWLYNVYFSKATASLFLSNFLRMRFPLRPVGRMSTSYRPSSSFLIAIRKPSEWYFFLLLLIAFFVVAEI